MPDLIKRSSSGWKLQFGKNDQLSTGRLGRCIPNLEGKLRRLNRAIRGNIVGTNKRYAGVEVGNESLRANHAGGGGIYSPSDPSGGFSNEGKGERGIRGVVSPMEESRKGREMGAMRVEIVVGECSRRAGLRIGGGEKEKKKGKGREQPPIRGSH